MSDAADAPGQGSLTAPLAGEGAPRGAVLAIARDPWWERLARSLHPASIPGPIFQKDIWISGRKRGTYWIRGLYAIGMLGLVTMMFLGQHSSTYAQGASQQLQSMQAMAPFISNSVLWFQFIALALAGTVFGAPTICEEKRAGTLSTLLATPLRAWQIVVGKTSAFFVQILILALVATPLLLAIRVFGGVTAELVFGATALSLSTSLLAGLLGLFHSIGAKRSPTAISGALVSLVALQGVVPLTIVLLNYKNFHVPWGYLTNASTPAALFMLSAQSAGAPGGSMAREAWLWSSAYTLSLCALVAMVSARRLRGVMMREAEGGSAISDGKKPKQRTQKRRTVPAPTDVPNPGARDPFSPLLDSSQEELYEQDTQEMPANGKRRRNAPVYSGASRIVGDHPVLWRETRQLTFRSRTQFLLTTSVLLGILGYLYWRVGMSEEGLHFSLVAIATVCILVIAAISTTAGISGERESRTWEVLLSTPLSARQVILGKFAGAVRRQWYIPALVALHLTVAGGSWVLADQGLRPMLGLCVLVILSGPILALSGTGVLFSLVCKKSSTAAAANFGLALLAWLVLPGVVGMLLAIAGAGGRSEDPLSLVMCLNPMGMAMEAVSAAQSGQYSLFSFRNIGPVEWTMGVVVYWVVYAGIGYGATRWAAAILAGKTGRAL